MRHEAGSVVWRLGRWRSTWPLAVAAGLVLVGRALVDEVGAPVRLLQTLRGLRDPWADPVAPTLSLLALLAETLVGYVLVVLALRSLCILPGSVGRAAGRVTLLVTPLVVRRLLDLLVGGTLLAQATLAATSGMPPGDHRPAVPGLVLAASISQEPAGPVPGHGPGPLGIGPIRLRQPVTDPVETRPVPRRSAAPLPPWLGSGLSKVGSAPTGEAGPGSTGAAAPESAGKPTPEPSGRATPGPNGTPAPGSPGGPAAGSTGEAAPGYTVAAGDTLWDIAAAHLAPGERTVANVHRYWRQVHRANRRVIGADPDLIHPGTRLEVPPFRRDRR